LINVPNRGIMAVTTKLKHTQVALNLQPVDFASKNEVEK